MHLTKRFLILCMGLCLCGMTFAQVDELAATDTPIDPPGPSPITQQVPNITGLLVVGTSSNVNDPQGTANMVYTIDPATDDANVILAATQVWGATADIANSRVLFTRASGLTPPAGLIGGGDDLYAIPFAGGDPVLLGRCTDVNGGFRVDGLAVSGGNLYGSHAGGTINGLYQIDWGTLNVTQVASWSNSISGIDADPGTGVIYGVDDSGGALVTVDTAGVITTVAAYPGGFSDIDGIAVGNGMAYMVTDEGGTFPVYDLAAGSYGTSLTSPFTSADTFSGAAIAAGGLPPDDGGVPATTGIGIALLVVLLGGGSAYYLRRK